jgi:two-component system, OmpR family, phosphate regulon sensor histidine kinase PhoR
VRLFGISIKRILPWNLSKKIKHISAQVDGMLSPSHNIVAPLSDKDALGILSRRVHEAAQRFSMGTDTIDHEKRQLDLIVNTLPEAVVVTNTDGVVLMANSAWYALFDSTPADVGRNILEIVRATAIFDNISTALASDTPTEREFNNNGKYLITQSIPFQSPLINGCITVIRDLSRIRRLEDLRREFTANVSHQMKTPLTSILGYSETLLDGAMNNTEVLGPFINTIHKQALKLKKLIEEIMELARIESPALNLKTEDLDVAVLLNDVADQFHNNKTGVIVNCDAPSITIHADPDSLRHIIQNLVDNAVKFTPAGGKVSVSAKAENTTISITISDTGVGIPEEDLPRVFERFYRIDPSVEGAGLGLAIAKHLTDRMGGTIKVSSHRGEGASFTITLPQ